MVSPVLRPVSEAQEHIALFKRAKFNRITEKYLYTMKMSDKLGATTGAIMQLMGQKAGTPDTFLAYPVWPFHGMWIELKKVKPRGSLSDVQKSRITLLRKVGYIAEVKWGWVDAWAAIERYLAGEYKAEDQYKWNE